MKTVAIAGLIAIVVLSTMASAADAQALASTLDRFVKSQTDTAKENALYSLLAIGRRDQIAICSPSARGLIRQTLITALSHENDIVHGRVVYRSATSPVGGSRLSESEMEYYANLIGCVAGMRDRSALPALLGAIRTGGGAINGVVALGEYAVPALIRFIDTPGSRGRVGALLALAKLASRTPLPLSNEMLPPLSPGALGAIRARLLIALHDENSVAREVAIEGLTPFQDMEVRRAIQVIAESDTTTAVGPHKGAKVYPVRGVARVWLQRDSLRSRGVR